MAKEKIPKKTIKNYLRQLYLISFIEGGVVMVTEIGGAEILTPFFGSSLYSWGGTLAITLLALMSGYYFGGYVTTKTKFFSGSKIVWVFLLSGLIVLLMPTLGDFIMEKTIALSFFAGLIISLLIFLFPPIFLMGMISPMIIFQITEKASQSGRSAGNIYALSTFGGILFTLVFSFLIVPNYGISLPVRVTGAFVIVLGLVLLIVQKALNLKKIAVMIGAILIGLLYFNLETNKNSGSDAIQVLERSEGLMGEIEIRDMQGRLPNGSPVRARQLRVNNIVQNSVAAESPRVSLLYYVDFTRHLLNSLPQIESTLLVGLGAGSLYYILRSKEINVESVEIDKRIYEYGREYFDLPKHDVNITDGRYYINTTNKNFDLVILDVAVGENIPGHLVSLECFQRCYDILSEDGILIIEHGGLRFMQENLLIPSIVKTLKTAGFHITLYNPLKSKHHGDILFVASKKKLNLAYPRFPKDIWLDGGKFSSYEIPLGIFNTEEAMLITDDKNNADFMLRSHYLRIRKSFRQKYANSH